MNIGLTALNAFNVITDYQYIYSVPMHNKLMNWLMVIFFVFPFAIYLMITLSVLITNWGKGIDSFKRFYESIAYFLLSYIALSTANMHLLSIDKS